MSKTSDLIREAESLPVEERVLLVDSLLRSLNAPENELDQKWAKIAQRRLQEIRTGQAKTIPGEEVFAKILGRELR